MSINGSHQSPSRGSTDRECTSFSSKVLLTSSTTSNHTADETDESVLRRWSQETCVFSTDIQKDALTDLCMDIHCEEDKQRWVRFRLHVPMPQPRQIWPFLLSHRCDKWEQELLWRPRNCLSQTFFLPRSFVSYVKALEEHPRRLAASKRALIICGDEN